MAATTIDELGKGGVISGEPDDAPHLTPEQQQRADELLAEIGAAVSPVVLNAALDDMADWLGRPRQAWRELQADRIFGLTGRRA